MADDVELGVINNLAHSMFSQVQVKFGGVVVENSNGLYGYKAYIQNPTNYTALEKNSLLYNEMYIEDRPEFFETTKLTNPKLTNNQKIKQIQDLFKEEKDSLMETKLYNLQAN